jgi:hypothetical protein
MTYCLLPTAYCLNKELETGDEEFAEAPGITSALYPSYSYERIGIIFIMLMKMKLIRSATKWLNFNNHGRSPWTRKF